MTDRELMQQALDALEKAYINSLLVESLRARLAQPEPDREKLFGVIDLDKDAPLTPEDRKQLRFGLMACLLEEGALAKLGMLINRYERTIESLQAQPEPEPVAWFSKRPDNTLAIKIVGKPTEGDWEPLYTAPPQREWQGLTDEEVEEVAKSVGYNPLAMTVYEYRVAVQKATEAKLKEKNGNL